MKCRRCLPAVAILPFVYGTILLLTVAASRAADKPEPQVTVTGRVLDADGAAASGVSVEVRSYWERIDATTDADGNFSIALPKAHVPGAAVLARSGDDTQMGFVGLPYETDAAAEPVELTLKPSERLVIQVTDDAGAPIAEARTGLSAGDYRTDSHHTDSLFTDDTGQAVHRLPADVTLLNVYAWKPATGIDYYAFYDPQKVRQDGPPRKPNLTKPITLVLSDPITVDVKVVDAVNDQPLPGTSVYPWLLKKPGEPDELNVSFLAKQVTVETDAAGVARFDWLPSWNDRKSITFWPTQEGYFRQRGQYEPGNVGGELTISLQHLVPITGQVRLPNGEPAADITIAARGRGYTLDDFDQSVQTDAEGRYEIQVAPNMVYLLVAADEKWAAPPQTGFAVMPGEPQNNRDFDLRPATRLFGRVTVEKDDKPVAGQSVQSYQSGLGIREIPGADLPEPEDKRPSTTPYYVRNTETDAEGRYELFVGPGTYDIRGPSQNKIEKFTITDETEREFNFHTPREERGRLKGRVVAGAPPRPVPFATIAGVSRYSLAGLDLDIATDADGRFDVERELHATVLHAKSADGLLAGVVEIGPDDTQVTIPIEPAASATGRLVNPDTKAPVPDQEVVYGVNVHTEEGAFRTSFGGKTVTDADGRFRLDQLVVGQPYDVDLTNPGGRGWRLLRRHTPASAELRDFGNVHPVPEGEASVPPSLEERIATTFAASQKTAAERLEAVLHFAALSHVRVLLILGDPDSAGTKEFFAAQADNRSLRNVLFDYRLLALSTVGEDVTPLRALATDLGIRGSFQDAQPRLVILSADRVRLADVSLADLQSDDTLDQTKLIFFLSQHRLPPLDARNLLDDALAEAKAQNKRVFVQETAPWCGWCWSLSQFLDDHHDVLGKDYLDVKVDERWKHADEVMHAIQAEGRGGMPWYAILDADGKVLATSNGPDGNIGFPAASEPEGIAHFLTMLRETAIRLSEDELDSLKSALQNP